jgi:murein DD-endopeptidase MepM/ murein hydrolase activator NlpD
MRKATLAILLFVFLICHSVLSSNNLAYSYPPKTPPTDTVPLSINEEDLLDYDDSVLLFPAYNLYAGWDTQHIHAPKFNIATLADSVKPIPLFDQYSCGFVPPFEGKITSCFGPRKRRYHYGADIDLETGDAVKAAFDGKVRIAQKSKTYGNVIVIRHSNGLETYYAHLSKLNVEVGQEIFAGDVIGLGGNTGRSRGSHLHFEVRFLGQPINPTDLISFSENKLVSDTLLISKKTFEYLQQAHKTAKASKGSKSGKITTASKGGYHSVNKGDTLNAIAKRYGTTTAIICKKNNITPKTTLRIGQKLKV